MAPGPKPLVLNDLQHEKKSEKKRIKGLTFSNFRAIIFPVMRDMYHVIDEDGLYRMFDVSHDGLEDAIEVANEIGTDVMRERDGDTETVWAFEGSDDDEPWDGFNSDAEADGDALASAGFGTDEDYGCFDSGDDDYGCEF